MHRTAGRLQQPGILHATGDSAGDQRAGSLKDGYNQLWAEGEAMEELFRFRSWILAERG
jgi:hypothetical protein